MSEYGDKLTVDGIEYDRIADIFIGPMMSIKPDAECTGPYHNACLRGDAFSATHAEFRSHRYEHPWRDLEWNPDLRF